MIYERPRLIRVSDVVNWSTGQWDEPFTRCQTGTAVEGECQAGTNVRNPDGSGDCFSGNSVVDNCITGAWTGGTHCSTGNSFPQQDDDCHVGASPGTPSCITGTNTGCGGGSYPSQP